MKKFRGIILTLAFVLTVISAYHLIMTVVSRREDRKSIDYAKNDAGNLDYVKQLKYYEKRSGASVFSLLGQNYTLSEVRDRSVQADSSISGGKIIVVELDDRAFIEKRLKSGNQEWIQEAEERKKKNHRKSLMAHFCDVWKEKNPEKKLKEAFLVSFIYGLGNQQENDKKVREYLENAYKIDEKQAARVLQDRLDPERLSGISVAHLAPRGIEIQLPSFMPSDYIKKMVESSGELLFQIVENDKETLQNFFIGLDKALKSSIKIKDKEGKRLGVEDLFLDNSLAIKKEYEKEFLAILKRKEIKKLLPNRLQLRLGTESPEQEGIPLFLLKRKTYQINIVNAEVTYQKGYQVALEMDYASGRLFSKITGNNIGEHLAIVMDERVKTAPSISQKITEGRCSINGGGRTGLKLSEAEDYVKVLKSGVMPRLRYISDSFIGPEYAEEAQANSLFALQLALLLVVLFMLLYYAFAGLLANLSLGLNVLFIIGILGQFRTFLSLEGIASAALTIGMAIDASVIIFEWIREDLRKGVGLPEAVASGYDGAFRSIFDSNLTTLLAGITLYIFGAGPIKSFAIMLIIGIFTSVFTSLFLTRALMEFLIEVVDHRYITFSFPFTKNLFSGLKIDFLGKRFYAYTLSGIFIATGFLLIARNGIDPSAHFTGGRVHVVRFDQPDSLPSIKKALSKRFQGSSVEVREFGGNNIYRIITNADIDDNTLEKDLEIRETIIKTLEETTGKKFLKKNEKNKPGFIITNTSKVASSSAEDIKSSSLWAIFLVLLIMLFYIFLSFRNFSLALASILALIHDVLALFAAMGIAKAFGIVYEIDLVFISCVLTIIGYSINDTVVIFSYLREHLKKSHAVDLTQIANPAINNTLSRTMITSFTTLIPILIMFFLGGIGLEAMAFHLLVGVLAGTFSSICISVGLTHDLMRLSNYIKRRFLQKPPK